MKTGVLLVALGGPRERGEIPSFVARMAGRELPPAAVAAIVGRYDKIGGRSPLCDITDAQAKALEEALGAGFVCRAGFRHARPSIEDSIEAVLESGVERLVFLFMSPFWSSFGTGDQLETARTHIASRQLSAISVQPAVSFAHSWYDNPFFLAAWAQRIVEDAGGVSGDEFVLFSAHSLPERLAQEPYRAQIERTVDAVAGRLSLKNRALGWQSIPTGAREPWIGPTVEDAMERVAGQSVRKMVQVPIGFTADHIETLFDIDIAHRAHAERLGVLWRRVPSLNDYPPFVRALAQIVDDALGEPGT
jgi:ferrochelatase